MYIFGDSDVINIENFSSIIGFVGFQQISKDFRKKIRKFLQIFELFPKYFRGIFLVHPRHFQRLHFIYFFFGAGRLGPRRIGPVLLGPGMIRSRENLHPWTIRSRDDYVLGLLGPEQLGYGRLGPVKIRARNGQIPHDLQF